MKLTTDPGWQLKATGDRLRLDIYAAIGEERGVGANAVRKAMEPYGDANDIDVHLNSPGGSAFDGITIYNLLSQHKGKVTVYIDGMAASAASVIAMAGDRIVMAENAMMMIHDASGLTIGNAEDHIRTAELLETLDKQLANTYARRTGISPEEASELMDAETWFTAEAALARGFADEVTEAKRIAACFDPSILNHFKNAPATVAERFTNQAEPATGEADPKENDMPDAITPEAFAEQYPDAVNHWKTEASEAAKAEALSELDAIKAEAATAAKTEGFDEGTQTERDRCAALVKAFKGDAESLLASIEAGHDVSKAKAEAFDKLQAKLAEQRNADAGARNDLGGGVQPVNAGAVDAGVDDSDPSSIKDPKARAEAEFAAMSDDDQAKYISKDTYVAARVYELKRGK